MTSQDKYREQTVELLSKLVACPSVNPGEARKTLEPIHGEAGMCAILTELLTSWGAHTQTIEFAPNRYNFVARFEGVDASRSLMLDAHSDTVSIDGMTIDPFDPAIRDGKLYGRGSCDTKGPMAAMLMGLRKVLDESPVLPINLYFVGTGDEELGARGAEALMKDGFVADAAIAAEPTDLDIVYMHKGACRYRITTHGKSAHSSTPSLGVNAIAQMAAVINELQGPLAEELSHHHHELLGSPTICVGTIKGGSQVNIVPDRCEIEVDRRTLPGESRETVQAEISRRIARLRPDGCEINFDIEPLQNYPPLGQCSDALLTPLEEACRAVTGKSNRATAQYGTNAGFFNLAGIDSVVFGPGSISRAHTADEFIELDAVFTAVDVYADFIRRFAKS